MILRDDGGVTMGDFRERLASTLADLADPTSFLEATDKVLGSSSDRPPRKGRTR
jgi:hypothetical protein